MHHERRPNQPYNRVEDPTEGALARIALGILAAVCMVALFALLVASLGEL